ncbi:hypothetical protein J1614_005891 [Plenodomus biglobosus]|nr:hypothetical protein J1614_005891 [Plenodomus biglobosus]
MRPYGSQKYSRASSTMPAVRVRRVSLAVAVVVVRSSPFPMAACRHTRLSLATDFQPHQHTNDCTASSWTRATMLQSPQSYDPGVLPMAA